MNAMTQPPRQAEPPREVETRTLVDYVGRVTLTEERAPSEAAGADAMAAAVLRTLSPATDAAAEVRVRTLTLMTRRGGGEDFDGWTFERLDAEGKPIGGRRISVDVVEGAYPNLLWLHGPDGSKVAAGAFPTMETAMAIGEGWVDGTLGVPFGGPPAE